VAEHALSASRLVYQVAGGNHVRSGQGVVFGRANHRTGHDGHYGVTVEKDLFNEVRPMQRIRGRRNTVQIRVQSGSGGQGAKHLRSGDAVFHMVSLGIEDKLVFGFTFEKCCGAKGFILAHPVAAAKYGIHSQKTGRHAATGFEEVAAGGAEFAGKFIGQFFDSVLHRLLIRCLRQRRKFLVGYDLCGYRAAAFRLSIFGRFLDPHEPVSCCYSGRNYSSLVCNDMQKGAG